MNNILHVTATRIMEAAGAGRECLNDDDAADAAAADDVDGSNVGDGARTHDQHCDSRACVTRRRCVRVCADIHTNRHA